MADTTIVQAVIDRLTGKTAYVTETLKDIGGGELVGQTGSLPLPRTLSDYSGTCDGAAHTVLAADATRIRLSLGVATTQASSVWVNTTGVATIDGVGSQEVAPGVTMSEADLGHPANAISLIGASGVKYTLKAG